MKRKTQLTEIQAHLVGDKKFAITQNKDAEYPFIVECVVKKASIGCESEHNYVVSGTKKTDSIENFYEMKNHDLFDDYETPMEIVKERIEREYKTRKEHFEKRLKELKA